MSIRRRRGNAAFVSICILVSALAAALEAAAATYSCGDGKNNHCYGTASWWQATEYFGAATDITQAALACPSGCGGFVNDEIWLVDASSAGCVANGFGMCWVEAGSLAIEGEDPVYFWADGRPTKDSVFTLHLLGAVDAPGNSNHYVMIKDGRSTPNPFQVFIYNDDRSTFYHGVSAVPSNTIQMIGKKITIGQELAGTKDASATLAGFSQNRWASKALDATNTFAANAQTQAGTLNKHVGPPTAFWSIDPAGSGCNPPPLGGNFTTHCCD